MIPGFAQPETTSVPSEPPPDRASIRTANLQALQALKGELVSTKVVPPEAEMQIDPAEDDSLVQISESDVTMANETFSVEVASTSVELNPLLPNLEDGHDVNRGLKRKFDEMAAADEEPSLSDDAGPEESSLPLKVNPDGTVEQVDTVR